MATAINIDSMRVDGILANDRQLKNDFLETESDVIDRMEYFGGTTRLMQSLLTLIGSDHSIWKN